MGPVLDTSRLCSRLYKKSHRRQSRGTESTRALFIPGLYRAGRIIPGLKAGCRPEGQFWQKRAQSRCPGPAFALKAFLGGTTRARAYFPRRYIIPPRRAGLRAGRQPERQPGPGLKHPLQPLCSRRSAGSWPDAHYRVVYRAGQYQARYHPREAQNRAKVTKWRKSDPE